MLYSEQIAQQIEEILGGESILEMQDDDYLKLMDNWGNFKAQLDADFKLILQQLRHEREMRKLAENQLKYWFEIAGKSLNKIERLEKANKSKAVVG